MTNAGSEGDEKVNGNEQESRSINETVGLVTLLAPYDFRKCKIYTYSFEKKIVGFQVMCLR